MRGVHRPDRGGPVGGHPPSGHRLPGQDAVQGGAEVKAGDLLFVIDPRPYKAQLDQAQGQVNLYQAQLKLARITSLVTWRSTHHAERRQPAAARPGPGRGRGGRGQGQGLEKNMEVYRLNHEFTRVVSPIDGMVSRYYLTLGNLVNQDQTLLTTVVSLDPMYAYFDVDEPTLLRVRKAINEGQDQAAGKAAPRSRSSWGCKASEGFPHEGKSTSSTTSSTPPPAASSVRGVFPNPEAPGRLAAFVARACSSGSACRSASRTPRCWSSTGPFGRTRG